MITTSKVRSNNSSFLQSLHEKMHTILKGLLVTSFVLHLIINAKTLNLVAMTTAAV